MEVFNVSLTKQSCAVLRVGVYIVTGPGRDLVELSVGEYRIYDSPRVTVRD